MLSKINHLVLTMKYHGLVLTLIILIYNGPSVGASNCTECDPMKLPSETLCEGVCVTGLELCNICVG